MSGSAFIYVTRWLVRDTFRQALASRVFWIMLAVSGLCTLFCLGVSIRGGEPLKSKGDIELYKPGSNEPLTQTPLDLEYGSMSLLFGAVRNVPLGGRDREACVQMLGVLFANFGGVVGLLLTLVWTAAFLPEFLQPSSASVLLAKPVPRWALLVGKYLGVLAFVAFQAAVYFLGTWLALGARTGVWLPGYLAGVPLLLLQFAAIYSFAVLLAVCTRSTVSCLFGALLFWGVCWAMNLGRHMVVSLPWVVPDGASLPTVSAFVTEAGYWILPKPADMVIILEQMLEAGRHFDTLSSQPWVREMQAHGYWDPMLSLISSLLFAVVMLVLSARQLAQTDY
jgi:ABC-type transport system involved in multi-copper enzyme maturation permease subunit